MRLLNKPVTTGQASPPSSSRIAAHFAEGGNAAWDKIPAPELSNFCSEGRRTVPYLLRLDREAPVSQAHCRACEGSRAQRTFRGIEARIPEPDRRPEGAVPVSALDPRLYQFCEVHTARARQNETESRRLTQDRRPGDGGRFPDGLSTRCNARGRRSLDESVPAHPPSAE